MTSIDDEALVLLLDRLVSSSSSEDVEGALEKLLDYDGDMERLVEQEPELIPKLQTLFLADSVLAAQMLLKLSKQKRSLLETLLLHECRLLESAIDVASDASSSNYARILALQLLQRFCEIPKIASSQWLSAPNGIHRVGDLLKDETVRTEALILGSRLAQWPSVAKVWIFAEIGNLVLETAIQEGGLTGGNLMVQDCLTFLAHLLSHDANAATLVFENPEILPSFSKLIDLRQGKEYLNPTVSDADAEDLDALLSNDAVESKKRVVPKLLPSEEAIISKVIDIFSNVLENESLRNDLSHKPIVTALWELALLDVTNAKEFPCAVPSSDLQCKMIALIAKYFNTMDILNRHGGLDRLLALVCTRSEHSIVQATLYLIRNILPGDVRNEMLMECLAPSPDTTTPASENVVRKLLITAMTQLDSETATPLVKNLLVGSLSALGVFVADDEARRSILFRITSVECPELWTKLMACVQRYDESDKYFCFHLWRFLVIAMSDSIVAEMLQNADIAQYVVDSDADMPKFAIGIMILNLPEETLCGGWTRATLLQSVQPWNNWMKALERLKKPNENYFHFLPEESLWIDWCAENVLKIRQCMVEEMTAKKGGEEQDVTLSTIVEEQSNELQTLRAALETAQRRVEAQEKELSIWEQRMQSNPTELDELLSASTAKISALDAKILSLEDQLRDESETYKAEVEKRDSKIAELDKRIVDAEATEAESRSECDTIREEMAALSDAYARLEDEYRLSQQKESRQTEGEESGQDGANGSTEVATLRAENQRLTSSYTEAQSWMAMADEKIREQEAELSILREQPHSSPPDDSTLIAKEGEILALRDELANIRAQSEDMIRSRDDEIDQLRAGMPRQNESDIYFLREENDRLNTEAAKAQEWMAIATAKIDSQEAELTEMREREADNGPREHGDDFAALEEELRNLRAELTAVRAKNDEDIKTREAHIQQLESLSTPDSEEISRLREANEAAQAWMQDAYNHHQSLEGQISTLTEDNHTLTEKITAQQGEISSLQALCDEKTSKIEEISSQMQSLHLQIDTSNSESAEELRKRCVSLEAELIVEKQEIALLQSRSLQTTDAAESDKIAELELTVSSLNNEILELRSSRSELLQKVSDLETTQIEVGATKEEIEQLRIRAHEAESRKASVEKILEAVSQEKEEYAAESQRKQERLAAESQRKQERLQEIENEVIELRKKEQNTTVDSTTFDDELAELHEENHNLRRQIESKETEANNVICDWQNSNESLQNRITAIEEERRGLFEEKESVMRDLNRCQTLLKESQELSGTLTKQVAELEETIVGLRLQIENLHEQLEDQEKDNAEVLTGWQDAYDEAAATSQTEINALKAKLSDLVGELQTIRDENSRLNQVYEDNINRDETPSNQSAGEDPKAPNHEFSSPLDLQDQMKTLQEESRVVISEWQEAYEGKVQEVTDLQNELDKVLAQSSTRDDCASESRCAELEAILQKVRNERDSLVQSQANSNEKLEKAKSDLQLQEQNIAETHGLLGIIQSSNTNYEHQHQEALTVIGELKQLQAKYEETCVQLQSADALLQQKDVGDLTITNLSEQLEDQRQEHEEIVRVWEESYGSLQSELDGKEKELVNLREQLQSVTREDSGHLPETDLGSQSNDACELLAGTEPQGADNRNDNLAEEKLPETTDVMDSWQTRHEAVTLELNDSRKQLEEYRRESENVIGQWQQHCDELQLHLTDLQSKYDEMIEHSKKRENENTEISSDFEHSSKLEAELELSKTQAKQSSEALVLLQDSYNALKQEYDESVSRCAESAASVIEEQKKCNELSVQAKEFARQSEAYKNALGRLETAHQEVIEQLEQVRERERISQNDDAHGSQLKEVTSKNKSLLQENEAYKSELVEMRKTIDDQKELLIEMESDLEKVKDDLLMKANDLEDATNVLSEWEASYADLSSEYEKLKTIHEMGDQATNPCSAEEQADQTTNGERAGIEADVQRYIDNETEYMRKIQVLEHELTEAREALDKEVTYLSKIKVLEEDVERLRLSHQITASDDEQHRRQVETLQSELEQNKLQAEAAIAEWNSCYQEVSAQLADREDQLLTSKSLIQELEEELRGNSDAANNPGEHVEDYVSIDKPTEYEATIKSLEDTIITLEREKKQEADDARGVIALWEAECNGLWEELEATEQLKETATNQESTIAERTHRISELQEETEQLQQRLDRALYEKSAFEAETTELRSQLALRSSEVDKLRRDVSSRTEVDPRQTTFDSLETRKIEDLLDSNQNLQHELDMARGEKTALEIRLASLDDNFRSQIETEKSESARMKEALEGERVKTFAKLESLEEDLESMRREKASWEQRCTDLRAEYSNLVDELEDTKNSLRLTVTDQATSEASNAAASLMRVELENLQDKLESIQEMVARERDAKESAEAESSRLRSSIAALLGMEDNDENRPAMEQRLMDATDSLQRVERSEISALKDALSRSLNELSEARNSEKNMEEKVASASHRANLYEADLDNCKNDFHFLSRTLDDMRDSEASKISSLQFRLSSIQNEHSVQTKIYTTELENLRNELSQSNMERERLLQALSESQSNRESINQCSSPDLPYGEDNAAELAQLRIEKANLLSAASTEASHMERRLRESRAMLRAAAQAEVIMEREMRLVAERSLESSKAEIEALRLSNTTQSSSIGSMTESEQLKSMQNQLDEVRASRESLEREIDLLRTELSDTRRERDADIARKHEECQNLRVRINHIEREGRFEAQVIAEAARLKAAESMTVTAPEAKDEKSAEVIALWDHIKELQEGIKNERTLYYEKTSEHENLLALLARKDLIKQALSNALASVSGEEAVEAVIQEASALPNNHLSL